MLPSAATTGLRIGCPVMGQHGISVERYVSAAVLLPTVEMTFQVHRFMLFISIERYVSAVKRYQDELITLTTRIVHSPAADVVSETMRSLPEEGILFVGM